jgi:hypothetical protein
MLELIKGTEALVGALLLLNLFVPLALAVITPVVITILAFHVFLIPSGTGIAVALVVLTAVLAWGHRDAYRPMLALRSERRAISPGA